MAKAASQRAKGRVASVEEPRLKDPVRQESDASDIAQRPKLLADFIGQPRLVRELGMYLNAAKARQEALDHVLLSGPPGLGKTTLAQLLAAELQWNFVSTSGPAITRAGDMAAVLMAMSANTVVFIDEIHRISKTAAETLYTAMEDRRLDLMVGEGSDVRSLSFDLPAFTLVGATTRPGMLPQPMLDRFGIPLRLDYYSDQDLAQIIRRSAVLLKEDGQEGAWLEMARRGRGTPRVAKRLLRRVRDFAHAQNLTTLTEAFVVSALDDLGIDAMGLDIMDRRYVAVLATAFNGGPTGVETLASALSEDADLLESNIEPYLMSKGLLQRTPRGRMLTDQGWTLSEKKPSGPRPGPLFESM